MKAIIDDISNSLLRIINHQNKPIEVSDNSIDFDTLFIQAIQQKFDKNTMLTMHYVWSLYQKAFQASKSSDFILATYYYTKANSFIDKSELPKECIKYINVYATPNSAYFHYKKNNFETALTMLREAIKNIESVECEHYNMHMGKIQQLHNISRLYLKCKNYQESLDIISSILIYLLTTKHPNYPSPWGKDFISRCDHKIVSDMFSQVFFETVSNIFLIDELHEDMTIKSVFLPLLNEKSESIDFNKIYFEWIECVHYYQTGNYFTFLSLAEKIIISPYQDFDILKFHLISKYINHLLLHNQNILIDFNFQDFIDKKFTSLPKSIKTKWLSNLTFSAK